jgi:SPP1 gp7 family putative phage head morphogenesis protein
MKAVNSQLCKKNAKEGITKLERLAVLDERTCDKCAALDGKIFTIEEAKVIDSEAHEGCRCTWVPAIDIPK